MNNPPWITEARKFLGQREIKGEKNNPHIVRWFAEVGANWYTSDEPSWCGAFVGHCLLVANRALPEPSYDAVTALKWSTMGMAKLPRPAYGSIFVMSRRGGGHVGFVVGKKGNYVQILGGNQSDMVKVSNFGLSNLVGFYWPLKGNREIAMPDESRYNLGPYSKEIIGVEGKVT